MFFFFNEQLTTNQESSHTQLELWQRYNIFMAVGEKRCQKIEWNEVGQSVGKKSLVVHSGY